MDTSMERTILKEEIKRLKEVRRRLAEHMTANNRLAAMGRLCAGLAHELNNPLSVILGFTQSLLHQHAQDETWTLPLTNMEAEALRCRRLVQTLLNFSRLPKPGKVLEDISQILEGALSLVEAQTRIRHIELEVNLPSDLPMVFIDRHQIQQMLINLCTNAIDAMPDGGRLTVRANSTKPSSERMWVEISVTDTGMGIPKEVRKHMFEPFFTTKAPGRGTGLGLSIVRDIVKDHEGRLEVLSTPGRGTTFTVSLPTGEPSTPRLSQGNRAEGLRRA